MLPLLNFHPFCFFFWQNHLFKTLKHKNYVLFYYKVKHSKILRVFNFILFLCCVKIDHCNMSIQSYVYDVKVLFISFFFKCVLFIMTSFISVFVRMLPSDLKNKVLGYTIWLILSVHYLITKIREECFEKSGIIHS